MAESYEVPPGESPEWLIKSSNIRALLGDFNRSGLPSLEQVYAEYWEAGVCTLDVDVRILYSVISSRAAELMAEEMDRRDHWLATYVGEAVKNARVDPFT